MDRVDHAGDDGESPPSDEASSGGGSALRKALRDIAPYLDLGWRLAGTASFPPLLGFGLDLWLHTTPWMLFGGCVVGLLGAVLQLNRLQNEFSS
ncbi:MAG: hypothetical protein BRD43_05425 [Bacteroidetes bacterium QS_4_64_154]|nr:MAG: hypothetical protein BRD43_05425 [Bacteroidetes bacterium QS_4_64_154]